MSALLDPPTTPIGVTLQPFGDFDDVARGLALTRFIDGTEPVGRELDLRGVDRPEQLVPAGSIQRRAETAAGARFVLARGDGWTAGIHRWTSGQCDVVLSAVDDEVMAKIVAEMSSNLTPVDATSDDLQVQFWFNAGSPRCRWRTIDAPSWADIARNYPIATRTALDALMAHVPTESDGRLIAWYGKPGTGKTTAARALCHAWRAHHEILFVTDPERLFGDTAYLMHLLLESSSENGWRLLVIEDADDLLRRGGGDRAAFARLLNVADGFVGHGLQLTVLLSTNESARALDPAMVRPGRCLAQVEFETFDSAGAHEWLGRTPTSPTPLSLAELVRERDGAGHPGFDHVSDRAAPGQYL